MIFQMGFCLISEQIDWNTIEFLIKSITPNLENHTYLKNPVLTKVNDGQGQTKKILVIE